LFYRDEKLVYFFLAAPVAFASCSAGGASLTNGIFSAYSKEKKIF
jgi:hypothetical protein